MEIVKGWHKRQREDKIQELFIEIAAAEVLTLQLPDAELAGRIYADLERTGQPIGFADRNYCGDLRFSLRRGFANAAALRYRYPKQLNFSYS